MSKITKFQDRISYHTKAFRKLKQTNKKSVVVILRQVPYSLHPAEEACQSSRESMTGTFYFHNILLVQASHRIPGVGR